MVGSPLIPNCALTDDDVTRTQLRGNGPRVPHADELSSADGG